MVRGALELAVGQLQLLTLYTAVTLAASSAWGQSGTIAGIVLDRNRPLASATVLLDGTDRAAITDSLGQFELSGVPIGAHRLTWHHPALDSLGLTMRSVPFEVRPNDTITVSLAKPSPKALVAVFCKNTNKVLVIGRVTRLDGGEPLPGVAVMAYGADATTDSVGRYHACISPGAPNIIHPKVDTDARRWLPPTPAPSVVFADIQVPSTDAYTAATISGRVVTDSGNPIGGATVSLLGMTTNASTHEDGRFELTRVPAGTQVLVVRKFGREMVMQTVELSAHAPYTVTVVLHPKPVTIAQVNVVATPEQLADTYEKIGFTERKKIGIGRFLTQDDIRRAAGHTTADALNGYTGIWIGDNGDHGINGDMIDSQEARLNQCTLYIVDGEILGQDDVARGLPPPDQVIAIEVYRQGEPKPIKVSFGADVCAEVLVWTKAELTQ